MKSLRNAGLDKIAEILMVTQKPTMRQTITQKCGFNNRTYNSYMEILMRNGLINSYPVINYRGKSNHVYLNGHPSRHKMIYQTSKTGDEFLRLYKELTMLVQNIETLDTASLT